MYANTIRFAIVCAKDFKQMRQIKQMEAKCRDFESEAIKKANSLGFETSAYGHF